MKFTSRLVLAFSLLSASVVSTLVQAADLDFEKNIELTLVNGGAYKGTGSLFDQERQVKLASGDQQIVFRVFDSFRESNSKRLFRSPYYVMTFGDQGDKRISLSTATPLRSLADANKFGRDPQFKLVDSQGKPVAFKMAMLQKDGVQVNRDLLAELHAFNATGHAAAIEARAPFAVVNRALVDSKQVPVQLTNSDHVTVSEQMLHYWFEQADGDTRQRFLSWAERTMAKSAK